MRIGVWSFYETTLENNNLLSIDYNILGELHSHLAFIYLSLDLKKNNIHTEIIDTEKNIDNYDLFIFFDFPKLDNSTIKKIIYSKKPKFLFLCECETIHPMNYHNDNLVLFDRCFTWQDDLVDNKKFFKIKYPSYVFPQNKSKIVDFESKKFSAMVASNNFNAHENDLYQERLNIINWFEKNHVDDFDLYGYRWELKEFKNRYLNKFNLIFKIFKNNLKVYKGIANNKKNLLPNYKFTFCLENSKNYQGYITEKIFHCFFYNTVPVYFGAKNIDKFIPKECYINYDYFDNMNELNKYLKSIDKIQYFNFLKAADEFLTSPKSNIFSIDYYKKVVIKEILYFRQLINK